MPLTNIAIRNIKASKKTVKLSDERGLYQKPSSTTFWATINAGSVSTAV